MNDTNNHTNNNNNDSHLLRLTSDVYEDICSFLRYKDLVRLSLTCWRWQATFVDIQRRLKELKAKNVSSRRRRQAYCNQLKACPGLRVLHFVNFPSTSAMFDQIRGMTELRELDLSGNGMGGVIPPCVGDLKHLEVLALANNQFTGPLPNLGRLTSLRVIRLSFNKLEGPIPNSWASLTRLEMISMSYNQLSGEIPEFLGNFSRLQSLLLGSNRLTGQIPPCLSRLESLTDLLLFENCLEGSVPEDLFTGCRRLRKLFLSGNKLSGKLPDSLGQLDGLRELILSSNNGLNGGLPASVAHLRCLKTLDLSGTHIITDNRRVLEQLQVQRCEVIV